MSEVPLYLLRTSAVPGLYPKTGTGPETPTPDVIRKEPWPFYRTISGVRLCWELEQPKGPKGPYSDISLVRNTPPPLGHHMALDIVIL